MLSVVGVLLYYALTGFLVLVKLSWLRIIKYELFTGLYVPCPAMYLEM